MSRNKTPWLLLLLAAFIGPGRIGRAQGAQTTEAALQRLEQQQVRMEQEVQDIEALLQRLVQSNDRRRIAFDAANLPQRGDSHASLLMVEFGDFECPFCRRFFQDTFPRIQHEFIDSGRLRYAFYEFPLEGIHPHAMAAAQAAECASPEGKFWDMHDLLYTQEGRLAQSDFLADAEHLGLSLSTFQACLAGPGADTIRNGIRAAFEYGVASTPTFFLGSIDSDGVFHMQAKLLGAQPFAAFEEAIEVALAGVRR